MKNPVHDLIDNLPKAELHLHIEGTLEPEMMLALAKRNKVSLPYETVEAVREAYQFDNLQDFLDVYYLGMSVLITRQDFYDLTWAYLIKVHSQGVRHVEIFFDPQGHTERGVAFDTVLEGITNALTEATKTLDITSRLIMCFLRHLPEDAGQESLDCACRHKDLIYAVGLDSSEKGHPPSKYSRLFARARTEGFITVAHAGEEGPAAYVAEALDELKVSRVDHGNQALSDPALVKRLAQQQTPLTMCPLSNLRLKGISDLREQPAKRAMDAGLLVTINSDDPSYFGGYIGENYKAIHKALELSSADIVKLAENSFKASFIDDKSKQAGLDKIQTQADIWRKNYSDE